MRRETPSKYEKLALILKVLGNPHALIIIDEAAKGFESGKATIKKLGLTPRKYYRCLEKLKNLGIITQLGRSHRLTPFGKFFHGLVFDHALTFLHTDATFLDTFPQIGGKSRLTVIDNYEDLVKLLIVVIEHSKSEILMATRYVDLSVSQGLILALQRGVKLQTITNESVDLPNFFRIIGTFIRNIRPELIRLYLDGTSYKVGAVPLSFILIDGGITVFEIPSKEFKIAFFSADKKVVGIFSDFFWEIWNKSQSMRIPLPK